MLISEIDAVGWVTIIGGVNAVVAAIFGGIGVLAGKWWAAQRESHTDSVKDYKELYLTAQNERAEDRLAWRKEVHDLRDDWGKDRLDLQRQMMEREKELVKAREEDNKRCEERLTQIDRKSVV